MVVKLIKWRPWPLKSKKYEVKIHVRCLTGLQTIDGLSQLTVEIKWKGLKENGFGSFRKKSVKREFTKEQSLGQNGVVSWDEEFKNVCGFLECPWEVSFLVFSGTVNQSKKMVRLAAPAVLNLVEFASMEDMNEFEINVPLSVLHSAFKCSPSLSITLRLMELKITQELPEVVQRQTMFAPLSPCFGGSLPTNKDESSTFKSSLRKVKSLTDYVSSRNIKKVYNGEGSSDSKFSTGSEDSESNYPFDTDSFDGSDDEESEESKEDIDVQKSCSYGTLMHANLAEGALNLRINCDDENLVYYSNNKPDMECSPARDFGTEASEQVPRQSPKFGMLGWRKGRLSFRSCKVKGEPLLKKDYGEDGGDDIDYDRRQLSFELFEELNRRMVSEFGDDNFAVGTWEQKGVLSRDGSMKLRTQVFFASIDQRNERAAGESACTSLVAVIADWLHSNQGVMPTKSEFDTLIREGSLQWRNLCENNAYKERFPDKHFDLETILEAKTIPLSAVPERSFIGFFHPEGLAEECFGFLDGAMSFDNIWDEICHVASKLDPNSEPLVYIVSWNDHFFLLRVDCDAYYIIDTLGERLYEGCNWAYVLKFDQDTIIDKTPPSKTPPKNEKTDNGKAKINDSSSAKEIVSSGGSSDKEEEEMMICKGKECCKEYIKSFLAAIPIRELQADMKKESRDPTLIHQRLQIEFNYTVKLVPPTAEYITPEMAVDLPVQMVALAVA